MFMNILRRKSFDDLLAHTQEKKLNKALGAFDITLMAWVSSSGRGFSSSPVSAQRNTPVPA